MRTEGLNGRDSAGFPPLPLASRRTVWIRPCAQLQLRDHLAVEREVETVAFGFFADSQADHHLNHEQND